MQTLIGIYYFKADDRNYSGIQCFMHPGRIPDFMSIEEINYNINLITQELKWVSVSELTDLKLLKLKN